MRASRAGMPLFYVFFILSVLSFSLSLSDRLYYTVYLEVFVFLVFFIGFFGVKRRNIYILGFVLIYFVAGFVVCFWRGVNVFDFITAYKFVLYFIVASVVSGGRYFAPVDIRKAYYLLVLCLSLKYFYQFSVGITDRPFLFGENNYELMMVALFFLIVVEVGVLRFQSWVYLLPIFLISGSRSSIVILFLVLLIYSSSRIQFKQLILGLFFLLAGSFAVSYIFLLRGDGIVDFASIDRFVFAGVFWDVVKDWGGYEYLFGADRLTALPAWACNQLAFYSGLFSYSGDFRCYSVILHSFWLRILYDHGVLMVFSLVYMSYFFLAQNKFSTRFIVAFLAAATLNGLSVSSFNSIYFFLPYVVAISLNRAKARYDEGD